MERIWRTNNMLLYILLLSITLFSIALQGMRPIISIYTHSLTGSPMIIGLVVGSYALFPMLLAVFVGKWLDGIGAYRMSLIGGIGIFAAFIIPVLYPSLPALFISQALNGFSQLCMLLSFQKTVGNMPGDRDYLMMMLSLTGSLGDLIGPLLTGFTYEYWGFQRTAAFLSVFVFIAIALGLTAGKKGWKFGNAVGSRHQKLMEVLSSFHILRHATLRKAIIAGGIVLYSKDLFVAYFPIYGLHLGLTPSFIGIIISAMALASVFVRLIQVWLVRTYGRGLVLLSTLVLAGIVFVLIPFFDHVFVLLCLAVLLGFGLGLGQPISMVYVMKITPKEQQGQVLGLRLTFNRGAQYFAPMLFGLIGSAGGILSIFWASGVLLLFSSWATKLPFRDDDTVTTQLTAEAINAKAGK